MLELSSYQLETTRIAALPAATVLNVTPDHLDRYPDLASYAAAKARIFARCDTAVINLDDPLVVAMPRPASRTLSFSLRAEHRRRLRRGRAGRAMVADAAAASRCWRCRRCRSRDCTTRPTRSRRWRSGEALGLPLPAMLAELASFTGLPHRSQWVAEIAGVRYVNDSKGTNVGATLAAVAGMAGPLVMIAGGDGKSQDFSAAARRVPRQGAPRRC